MTVIEMSRVSSLYKGSDSGPVAMAVQVPTLCILRVKPDAVQTEGVLLDNVGVRPEGVTNASGTLSTLVAVVGAGPGLK